MANNSVALVLIILSLQACRSDNAETHHLHTLPSGKQVKVIEAGRSELAACFPDGLTLTDRAFVFRYQTEVGRDSDPAIQDEVEEVWESIRQDVELANLQAAVVSVIEGPGVELRPAGKNYLLVRGREAGWRFIELLPDVRTIARGH